MLQKDIPRAGPGVVRISRTPPSLAQSVKNLANRCAARLP